MQELDERVQLEKPILERRTGEDERVAAPETLGGTSRLRVPVLDPLGLVEDHVIGRGLAQRFEVPQQ